MLVLQLNGQDSCDDDIAAAVVAAWSAGDTPEGCDTLVAVNSMNTCACGCQWRVIVGDQ